MLACIGCGGAATDAGPTLAGGYELASVNGMPMPVPVPVPVLLSVSGNDTTYLETELLIASPGGIYQTAGVQVADGPSTFGQAVRVASSGTYSANVSAYTFTDKTLGSGSGSLIHGTLTITFSGKVYIFSLVQ